MDGGVIIILMMSNDDDDDDGEPVEHAEDKGGGEEDGDRLQTEPPPDLSDDLPQSERHGGQTEARGGDQQDLHLLSPPLEVLAEHQGGRVPDHPHPDADDEPVGHDELVEVEGEGGEETTEGGDEAAHYCCQPASVRCEFEDKRGKDWTERERGGRRELGLNSEAD